MHLVFNLGWMIGAPVVIDLVGSIPSTLFPHPIPYTLYPIPYTPYPILYTLYPIPYTLYPIPYTLYPINSHPNEIAILYPCRTFPVQKYGRVRTVPGSATGRDLRTTVHGADDVALGRRIKCHPVG